MVEHLTFIHLQLRYLQTLNSISAENNSTIVFPVPIDTLAEFMSHSHPAPAQYPYNPDWRQPDSAIPPAPTHRPPPPTDRPPLPRYTEHT